MSKSGVMAMAEAGSQYATIPGALLADERVSVGAKTLFALLDLFVGDHDGAWPAQASLGKLLGLSERQIRRWLGELEAAGWVKRRQRGLTLQNVYQLEYLNLPALHVSGS